jgi:hypothetical protein
MLAPNFISIMTAHKPKKPSNPKENVGMPSDASLSNIVHT